jgi:hypothetical protein
MKKRYTVRAIEERMVEVTVEAESPIDAMLKAEQSGTKWKACRDAGTQYKYIIKSSRPAGA